VNVLALLDDGVHEYTRLARPLLRALGSRHDLRIDVAPTGDGFDVGRHQVVLAATDRPLSAAQASRLRELVARGGGLIVLHGTLAAWAGPDDLFAMAGWAPVATGPESELVVRPDLSDSLTQRLDGEWKIRDELYLSEGPPLDSRILLRASWRFTEQVVAYARPHGEGWFAYVGLGHNASTYEDPNFQKLVGRLVLLAAGSTAAEAVGVGLVGYGAIARDHAAAITAVPGLRLAGVCDLSAERRELAAREWSVGTHSRLSDMLDDPEVGLVVVGTPPSAHTEPVIAALNGGRHVVCEKPFALHVEDVDRMIDTAVARKRVLTVYQSRRWDPDFIAMRDVVRSGAIGELFYMETFIGGFSHPCDFWHSHEPISGGTIYDWGSHYFDWILQLFGEKVVSVSAQSHKRVWHDVTNADQVRVDLTFAGGTQAMFLQSDIAAAPKPKWYVLGTEGAVVGEWRDEEVPADHPARVKVLKPGGAGAHEQVLSLSRRDDLGFYRNLADHLAWNEPLAVTPAEARRTVAVMEAATHSIARSGAAIEVDI